MAKKKRFNDQPFPYHAEIELEIATLTNLGVGLGRVSIPAASTEGEGGGGGGQTGDSQWVVMVPFALPGERVRARVFRNHKNYSEADLLAVLTPSPDRVTTPPCPLFGRCGGCQYQNFNYAAQLVWKRRQVGELLRHMAGIESPVSPVIGSPRQYGYRSKITPHFNPRRDASGAIVADMPIGFLRQGTRFDLLDVPRCEIATDAINARLTEVRAEVQTKAAAGAYVRGATLLLRDASGVVTTNYDDIVTEQVGDLRLRFLARDFFQNNPFILPAFTGYVREQAAASGARFLVDAYCGSGLFALSAASAFERVTGIEISESSIAFARQNAALNGITNTTFQAGDASAIFAGLTFPAADTAVIIDPPRKGCDESFLQQLFGYGPRTVVYVSCDPATQMRDLRHFLAAGYELTAVQPFDLFPQTRHLECVITLRAASRREHRTPNVEHPTSNEASG
ncbi:class I SAM-dependent RNA methyltransferase [Opitutaceae bacterium TAV3]|nr:class I SAM-dependent RNA methyltransferase [Opitutaceae bacterium TAV3]